jgi:hypothetical protein
MMDKDDKLSNRKCKVSSSELLRVESEYVCVCVHICAQTNLSITNL